MFYVDNYTEIRHFLDKVVGWKPGTWFFQLQIIQRSKDGNNKSSRILDVMYIDNPSKFDKSIESIREMCVDENARAYINLNPKSYELVAYETIKLMVDRIPSKQFKGFDSIYSSAVGRIGALHSKTWILDCDDPFIDFDELKVGLEKIEPFGDKIYLDLPTKNGRHLIVSPFNLQKFKVHGVSVHKNNPTLLFCP